MPDLDETLEKVKDIPKVQDPGEYRSNHLREVCLEVVNKLVHNINAHAKAIIENKGESVEGKKVLKDPLVAYNNQESKDPLVAYNHWESGVAYEGVFVYQFEGGKDDDGISVWYAKRCDSEDENKLYGTFLVFGPEKPFIHPMFAEGMSCHDLKIRDLDGKARFLITHDGVDLKEFSEHLVQEEMKGRLNKFVRFITSLEYLRRAEEMMRGKAAELDSQIDSLIQKYEGEQK